MAERLTEATIVYCQACGHSAGHTRLSIGSDDCGRTLIVLTPDQWIEIAKSGALTLTDAGRRALGAEG